MHVLVFRPHINLEGLIVSLIFLNFVVFYLQMQVWGIQQALPSRLSELATRVLGSKSLIDAFSYSFDVPVSIHLMIARK